MRIHRLEYDDQDKRARFEWFGTEAEVKATVKERQYKPYEYDHMLVEIPTDKAGLIAWLNEYLSYV